MESLLSIFAFVAFALVSYPEITAKSNVIEDFCQTQLWLHFNCDLTELHPIPNKSIVVKRDMSSTIRLFLSLIQIMFIELALLSAWALLLTRVLVMVLASCAVARFGMLFINSFQNS